MCKGEHTLPYIIPGIFWPVTWLFLLLLILIQYITVYFEFLLKLKESK